MFPSIRVLSYIVSNKVISGAQVLGHLLRKGLEIDEVGASDITSDGDDDIILRDWR